MKGDDGAVLDEEIVALYWERSEKAIAATQNRYGSYCYTIALRILNNHEDAEECANDTYLAAWESIPPHRPQNLSTFLGKLARRIAIDKWRRSNAGKRGGGEIVLALEELGECVPGGELPEDALQAKELTLALNRFLTTLSREERGVFVGRYWHMLSVTELAKRFGIGTEKVKSMLHRIRKKLRIFLEREGVAV